MPRPRISSSVMSMRPRRLTRYAVLHAIFYPLKFKIYIYIGEILQGSRSPGADENNQNSSKILDIISNDMCIIIMIVNIVKLI